jgi:hypothetical protein
MLLKTLSALLVLGSAVFAQTGLPKKDVTAAAGGTGTITWSNDTVYVLNGFVRVLDGQVLTIEPGTVVKGKAGQQAAASALVVARGGKLIAKGTAQAPIIFTAEADSIEDIDDLPMFARGLWGGVSICGRASLNNATNSGMLEGFVVNDSSFIRYGGTDDTDSSGVLEYVSIRYSGVVISTGNEINGLTMAALGSRTVINHIEVYCSADDGYEWFGGTVNTKYLVSAFNDDDGFDYDAGYRGKGQFWFLIQEPTTGDKGGEFDGGTTPEDGMPYAIPTIHNVTMIGSGATSASTKSAGLNISDNAGGHFANWIMTDFPGYGIYNVGDEAGEDSRHRLEVGDLTFNNFLWYGFKKGNLIDSIVAQSYVRTAIADDNHIVADPHLRGISRTWDGGLDPRPSLSSPALISANAAATPNDEFFTHAPYLGAFTDANYWIDGWTFLAEARFLGNYYPTGIMAGQSRVPTAPAQLSVYPHPVLQTASVTYQVPRTGRVGLTVLDLAGNEVSRLTDGVQTAGTYRLVWDGRNNAGAAMGSGLYLCHLTLDGKSLTTTKLYLVK